MSSLDRMLKQLVRRWLLGRDTVLTRLDWKFGIDWLHDVKKLSKVWHYPTRTFFDVGANVGQTALAALDRFPGIAVFSFEPHPNTFEELRRSMAGQRTVEPIQLALGAKKGSAAMFEYDQNKINSLIPNSPYVTHFPQEARQLQVEINTIDDFCNSRNIDSIDVLKIDTEGFDLEVLMGARMLLQDHSVKFVYVEFNRLTDCSDNARGSLYPIADMLSPFGFRFVASYNDYILPEENFFAVSNALFALPPI